MWRWIYLTVFTDLFALKIWLSCPGEVPTVTLTAQPERTSPVVFQKHASNIGLPRWIRPKGRNEDKSRQSASRGIVHAFCTYRAEVYPRRNQITPHTKMAEMIQIPIEAHERYTTQCRLLLWKKHIKFLWYTRKWNRFQISIETRITLQAQVS